MPATGIRICLSTQLKRSMAAEDSLPALASD
jgi:hypothetical protein